MTAFRLERDGSNAGSELQVGLNSRRDLEIVTGLEAGCDRDPSLLVQ